MTSRTVAVLVGTLASLPVAAWFLLQPAPAVADAVELQAVARTALRSLWIAQALCLGLCLPTANNDEQEATWQVAAAAPLTVWVALPLAVLLALAVPPLWPPLLRGLLGLGCGGAVLYLAAVLFLARLPAAARDALPPVFRVLLPLAAWHYRALWTGWLGL